MWLVRASRVLNGFLGGDPNVMLSSAVYMHDNKIAVFLINHLFFWQENHCRKAFRWEFKEENIQWLKSYWR
jgi:hypothetical protein